MVQPFNGPACNVGMLRYAQRRNFTQLEQLIAEWGIRPRRWVKLDTGDIHQVVRVERGEVFARFGRMVKPIAVRSVVSVSDTRPD